MSSRLSWERGWTALIRRFHSWAMAARVPPSLDRRAREERLLLLPSRDSLRCFCLGFLLSTFATTPLGLGCRLGSSCLLFVASLPFLGTSTCFFVVAAFLVPPRRDGAAALLTGTAADFFIALGFFGGDDGGAGGGGSFALPAIMSCIFFMRSGPLNDLSFFTSCMALRLAKVLSLSSGMSVSMASPPVSSPAVFELAPSTDTVIVVSLFSTNEEGDPLLSC
mmetsp:Transcript_18881/g.39608  ORF Transcript_18881/g.39608 Transcript_18881/m.39608 type:complete len:222 (+) Transcript_18881:1734-2399(+)